MNRAVRFFCFLTLLFILSACANSSTKEEIGNFSRFVRVLYGKSLKSLDYQSSTIIWDQLVSDITLLKSDSAFSDCTTSIAGSGADTEITLDCTFAGVEFPATRSLAFNPSSLDSLLAASYKFTPFPNTDKAGKLIIKFKKGTGASIQPIITWIIAVGDLILNGIKRWVEGTFNFQLSRTTANTSELDVICTSVAELKLNLNAVPDDFDVCGVMNGAE